MVLAETHEDFTFVIEAAAKKFDSADDVISGAGGSEDKFQELSRAKGIKLSGNSFGFEACKFIADQLAVHDTPLLVDIDFSDIFVSRLRAELPDSLRVMSQTLLAKQQLIRLNLSDNAFGPDGISAFECLLTGMSSLQTLQVTNCGLGPEGGEMIAEALSRNEGLKLKHFEAGRDRLENKGITALARVFAEMGSLETIHVPQNGIKDEGMSALLSSLAQSCTNLTTLRINDNWLKAQALPNLFKVILRCSKLDHLNISDLNMGQEPVIAALTAIKDSEGTVVRELFCNYNEVDSRAAAIKCCDLLEEIASKTSEERSLERVDFIGLDSMARQQRRNLQLQFADRNVTLKLFEDGEDDEEDDDDEEDQDDEDDDEGFEQDKVDALLAKIAQIKEGAE
uniref:Ran GTPase-activating protein 1 n=1 Tax=Favella ehrenbergii TaxID=182087 RepID=A0A7S3MN86_9SPIT